MPKITQKELIAHLSAAFDAGSTPLFKDALKLGSDTQIKSVYYSKKWSDIIRKHGAGLTPYKSYAFAKAVFTKFGPTSPFEEFLQNSKPVGVYLNQVRLNEKPQIASHIRQWVRDCSIHSPAAFVFLNEHLEPHIAKMDPHDFIKTKDVWWPSCSPEAMRTIAALQPDFVNRLQKTIATDVPQLCGVLNTLTKPSTPSSENEAGMAAIRSVMGGERPYLFHLISADLHDVLFRLNEENDAAQQIATVVARGEVYINVIALQTWNTYAPLSSSDLLSVYTAIATLDSVQREKIETFSNESFSNVTPMDFLNLCQAAYLKKQLGSVSSTIHSRKM